jgi:hypothetical protein
MSDDVREMVRCFDLFLTVRERAENKREVRVREVLWENSRRKGRSSTSVVSTLRRSRISGTVSIVTCIGRLRPGRRCGRIIFSIRYRWRMPVVVPRGCVALNDSVSTRATGETISKLTVRIVFTPAKGRTG